MPTITIYLNNENLAKLAKVTGKDKTLAKKASEILREYLSKKEA